MFRRVFYCPQIVFGLLFFTVVATGCLGEPIGDEGFSILAPGEKAGWAYWDGSALVADRSYNSSAGSIVVTRLQAGLYRVRFAGLSDTAGNVQISAVGSGIQRCKIALWLASSGDEDVYVFCVALGSLADSPFVVSYSAFVGGNLDSTLGLYATIREPGGAPIADAEWGADFSVGRVATGFYAIHVAPPATFAGGNIQVTAIGGSADYCNSRGWGTQDAWVLCFDESGAPVNTEFSFRYHHNEKLHDSNYGSGGFAWSNVTSFSGCRTPALTYQFNYMGGDTPNCQSYNTNTICKPAASPGPGRYTVYLPDLQGVSLEAAVPLVTGYGTSSNYCKVESWEPEWYGGAVVNVLCWDTGGAAPEDTRFLIMFMTNASNLC